MKINIRKVTIFLVLTFSVDWLIALLFYVLGGKWNTPFASLIGLLYMFVPMVMAIIVQKKIYKEPVIEPLGVSIRLNRWFLVAWLLMPVVSFATFGLSLLLPGVEFSPEMVGMLDRFKSLMSPEKLKQIEDQIQAFPIHPLWLGLIQGLMAGVTINAIAAFGEELGWRGFLQKEFSPMGFWRSSLLVGFIWGVWHAPIILQGHNYSQHPVAGAFMMVLWCILLAPIHSYIRLRAKSVLAAAVLHGTLNGTAGLSLMVVKGGNDLLIGISGLAGIIVLFIVNIGLYIYERTFAKEPVEMPKIADSIHMQ